MSNPSFAALKPVSQANAALTVQRVKQASGIQKERYKGLEFSQNAQIPSDRLQDYCKLDTRSRTLMEEAYPQYGLSVRGYHKVLRVARTIADLESSSDIRFEHLAEALQLRLLDPLQSPEKII